MIGLLNILTGGIPWKLIGGGILIATIIILIWIHIKEDRAKDNKITELYSITQQLELDKVKLVTSNGSLTANIERQRTERAVIVREFTLLRQIDSNNQIKLDAFRKQLNSKERKARIRGIINSRKKSLLLRNANKQAHCQWENYDNFEGHCIGGKYRK